MPADAADLTRDAVGRDGARATPAAWATLAILVFLSACSYMDRQIVSLMIDPIGRHFGIGDVELSLLHGVAFALFYVLAALPIGWAVDRFSRRRIIHAGVTVWSLAATACGLAASFPQLLVARALVGAGEGALAPAAYSMLADLFPKRRLAFALGVFATGSAIGSGAALMIGGRVIASATRSGGMTLPLLGHLEPWQVAFVATSLPGLLLALLVFLVPEPRRRNLGVVPRERGLRPLLEFVSTRKLFFLCHLVGFGLLSMMIYGSVTWAPTFLMRNFQMSAAEVGLGLGISTSIGGTAGFVGGGWIVDRWFRSGRSDAHFRYHVIVIPVAAVLLSIAFNAATPAVFLVLFGAASMLIPFNGIAAAVLQIVTPNRLRGQVSSIFIFCTNLLGIGLGPVLVAVFTNALHGGPEHVGSGVVTAVAVLAPIATALMLIGQRPARVSVDVAAAWGAEGR